MKFQAGDKVRYIEESDTLTNGEVYTVSGRHGSGQGIHLEGFNGRWWYDRRFELAEVQTPTLVRSKDQVRADRRTELLNGVVAYHTQGKEVPQEWIEELYYQR